MSESKSISENWVVLRDKDGKPCALSNSHGKPENCLITIEADFDDDDQRELFYTWMAGKLNSKVS